MDTPSDIESQLTPLDDAAANRDLYYGKIRDALSSTPSAANDQYELRVEDVEFKVPDASQFGKAELKRRRMRASTMQFPVKGRYRLYDKATGGVVGESGVKTLMQVPWIADDGSMLRSGVAVAPLNQARLLPSVYHRVSADGHPEAQFNSAPGSGSSFKAWLDGATGVFSLQEGGKKLPLYHVLRDMGVDDAVLEDAWGRGVLDENRNSKQSTRYGEWRDAANASGAVARMRADGVPVVRGQPLPEEYARDTQANLLAYFGRTRFDPASTRATLGAEHASATPDAIVASTRKLLGIHRGTEQTDDRDSLQFQTVYDMGDVLAEKIKRDQGGVLRNTLWKLAGKWQGDLSKIPSGLLDEHVKTFMNSSGLVQTVDQVNPYEVFNHVQRLVRMGEGGISSLEAVPREARNVIPSYLGYVDPIRSPECGPAEMQMMTSEGWKSFADIKADTQVACLIDNRLCYNKPDKLHVYDFDGDLYCASEGDLRYEVTGDHRMWLYLGCDKFEFVKASEVHGQDLRFRSDMADHAVHTKHGLLGICSVKGSSQFTKAYSGKVYCVSVPGGLIYVKHEDASQGFWCGNSLKVGVDSFIARDVAKGRDGQLYKKFMNERTGKPEWLGMRSAAQSVIAVPDYDSRPDDEFVPALVRGKQIQYVPRKDVEFSMLSGDDMFSAGGLSVPMLSQIKGKRYSMGAKYLSHSLPLEHREVPLVQGVASDGRPYAEYLGEKGGIVRSGAEGTVKSVGRDAIVVSTAEGDKTYELHDDYPLARKTRLSNIPQVAPGQKVRQGQLLASSNYTDDKGRMAIGVNLRTLYAPYMGRNFEDGMVVSEGAAKKLVANMMYTFASPTSGGAETDSLKYRTLFPGKYDDRQFKAIDDTGVVKVGTVVRQGDPLVLSHTFERPALSSMGAPRHLDNAIEWDHESPGVVTAVERTDDGGWNVAVKSNDSFRIGDKIALPFGNKGVTARCVPDERMPHDEQGQPIELILNPLGVISRVNTAQLVAAALGKVAAKTGKPYVLPAFSNQDMAEFAINEAKKHGVKLEENVYDPILKTTLPNMFVGNTYTYRLQQTAEAGGHSRGTGGYTLDDTPARGGHEGCFVYGQTVKTLDGDVAIGEIVRGRLPVKAWTFEGPSGGWVYREVSDWFERLAPVSDVMDIEIQLDDGSTTRMQPTRNHKIYLFSGKVVEAGELAPGDHLKTWCDKSRTAVRIALVKSVEDYVDPEGRTEVPVFDITVDEAHKYTVAKVLVSNSKHLGSMELHSLIAAGAQDVIKDAKIVRGQANPEFWRDVRAGRVPQMPGESAVREKFKGMVRGAAVNYTISPEGAHTLFAMTNDDVKRLTGDRRITTADTFDSKTYRPVPGGMFDEAATGSGNLGDSFAYYETPEPLLNPMMEPVARSLMGVTKGDLMRVVQGDVEYKGQRGGAALKAMLAGIDLDATAARALQTVKDGKASKRDAALKQLGFVRALQSKGVTPDQFMLDRIPVVPPKYRPIIETGDRVMVSDLNYLYKKYVDAVQDYHDAKDLGDDAQKTARLSVYKAFKAVTGMEDPEDPELQKKKVGGVLDLMLGKGSPKMGFSARKLLESDVDMTGLGVAVGDPDLRLDQLGVPETRLWDMYRNFVIRRLRQGGMQAASALKSFQDRDDGARRALLEETKLRPMLLNRAPTLHRYSVQAVWPVPVEGEAVRVNPAIVKPFNLDFDGDKVSYMIPATDKAVASAAKHLTPAANLIGARDMRPNYVPQQEYLLGLYAMSREAGKDRPAVRFKDAKSAIAAYRRGEIGPSDPVLVD